MRIAVWRKRNKWSLARLGEALSIGGSNPGRAAQRIERGEAPVDADMAEAIGKVTGGDVTLQDLHDQRLEWKRRSEAAQ